VSGAVVVVVGDVMVDVVAVPTGPIARGTDTPSQVLTTGGGSAANTACWLAHLGASVRLAAAVGDDELGRSVRTELDDLGVAFVGHVDDKVPTGICVVLIDETGERTMLPDRGANEVLSPAVVEAAIDADAAWVHVSGYALLGSGSHPAAVAAIAAARRLGLPWSVDAASAAPLEAVGPTRFLRWLDGCTVLFANEDELDVLGGVEGALAHADEVVLKLGPAGASWTNGAGTASSPAAPATVVDTIGAGDAFDAGFVAARLQGSDPAASLHAGGVAAARAVSQRGARP
jgi:sugar/nucleoside kinase (ribokinase family)